MTSLTLRVSIHAVSPFSQADEKSGQILFLDDPFPSRMTALIPFGATSLMFVLARGECRVALP
jgi:hypothetical protein